MTAGVATKTENGNLAMNGTRGNGDGFGKLESCLEFRNADIKAFVRHLHERRCEKCWAVFAAAGQAMPHDDVSGRAQRSSEARWSEGRHVHTAANCSSLDRWLIKEYSLIPRL